MFVLYNSQKIENTAIRCKNSHTISEIIIVQYNVLKE